MAKRIRKFRILLDFPSRTAMHEWVAQAKKRRLFPPEAELHAACATEEDRADFTFQEARPRRGSGS